MADIKRVTLHPLKQDGSIDIDTNLYPKTLLDGIVDREGNEVEVALKEEIPTNYVTTDTAQTITGVKTFANGILISDSLAIGLWNQDKQDYDYIYGGTDGGNFTTISVKDLGLLGNLDIQGKIGNFSVSENGLYIPNLTNECDKTIATVVDFPNPQYIVEDVAAYQDVLNSLNTGDIIKFVDDYGNTNTGIVVNDKELNTIMKIYCVDSADVLDIYVAEFDANENSWVSFFAKEINLSLLEYGQNKKNKFIGFNNSGNLDIVDNPSKKCSKIWYVNIWTRADYDEEMKPGDIIRYSEGENSIYTIEGIEGEIINNKWQLTSLSMIGFNSGKPAVFTYENGAFNLRETISEKLYYKHIISFRIAGSPGASYIYFLTLINGVSTSLVGNLLENCLGFDTHGFYEGLIHNVNVFYGDCIEEIGSMPVSVHGDSSEFNLLWLDGFTSGDINGIRGIPTGEIQIETDQVSVYRL